MTDLSIILVNWNCLAFTEQCLASIRESVTGISYEVIVVDNDSSDAPCQSLVDNFSWAKLILSKENIGFGRANNLGVHHSFGKNLLFLNPDTVVHGDALRRMVSELESIPVAGVIGCKLLNPDGSLQSTCVQPFPTILNQLLALDFLQRRWPDLRLWGRQALFSKSPDTVHEVDFVSGAAILVNRVVFEEVGGFNPEYFMFAEEADLCWTIHRAGYKVLHTSNAVITHYGGQSTKTCEDDFASVTMRESVYRFMYRNRGSLYAYIFRLTIIVSALTRICLLICILPFAIAFTAPSGRKKIARAFRKWMKIARWAVGRDVNNNSASEFHLPTASADN
jgi:GT2 family glycosyltransferase